MSYTIKVTKSSSTKIEETDFSNLPFGKTFSDHMFVADYYDGQWQDFRIEPFANLELSPVTLALHYGQSIFEGMKATAHINGNPLLFRPEMHAKRLNISAARMGMPDFPKEIFLEALHTLVDLDKDWVPTFEGGALYIRPLMFASDDMLGVRISDKYKFLIFTGPVGLYYPKPVKLLVADKYVRAADGGVGYAKTAGNYAATLMPMKEANEMGYDQIMWMDSQNFKFVQECGTMNLFFIIDGVVITPPAQGTILKGITRDSFLKILKKKGYKIQVRDLSIDEIVAAYHEGKFEDCFGSGTAAVVAPVSEIKYQDLVMKLPEHRPISTMLKAEVNGLRKGTIQDEYDWIIPVEVKEPVS